MNEDDKRLVAWALRAYAERCESSPLRQWAPKGESRDAKRCRELADHFHPYNWQATVISTKPESETSKPDLG